MKVSITGADGFLGSYLCNYLEKRDIEVLKITRTSGYDLNLISNQKSRISWSAVLKNNDAVIHCASKVHDFDNCAYKEFKKINVDASCQLLRLAILMKVKKFIYISSIKVLGETSCERKPFNSQSIPNPKGNYSNSKFEAEEKLKEIACQSNIRLIIIRPPLIYGPDVGANFLKMMNLIYKRIPLPFKKFSNKRSLVFVGNISDLIYNCLLINFVKNCVLLISDNELVSTNELMQIISLNFGYKLRLFKFPLIILSMIFYIFNRKNQLERISNSLVVDISETKQLLNWIPPYKLKEGIRITTDAYIKSLSFNK